MSKKNTKRFKIINEQIVANMMAYVFEMVKQATKNPKTKKHVVVTVELLTDDELRTLDQNSLYWLWLTAISNYFGNSKYGCLQKQTF